MALKNMLVNIGSLIQEVLLEGTLGICFLVKMEYSQGFGRSLQSHPPCWCEDRHDVE